MSDSEIETDQMREALSAIAQEIQRFHNESVTSCGTDKHESSDLFNNIIKYKTCLKLRKEEIKTLRQNLKTACIVAKTLSSAKETETATLNSQLTLARTQYLDLVEKQNEKLEKIAILTTENQALRNKIDHFYNFIQLGYKELQKMRNESSENIPVLKQLQKIIVCCGEYYAEYCNEQETNRRLEQKNRFLSNKLHILESNLEATSDELQNIRVKNSRLRKEKGDPITTDDHSTSMDVLCPFNNQSTITNYTLSKLELKQNQKNTQEDLNLSDHLNMVKKLINDQDNLLNILKCLSKEINEECTIIIKEDTY